MSEDDDQKDGMLEVDDNFGLDDESDEEYMPQDMGDGQEMANFDDMQDGEGERDYDDQDDQDEQEEMDDQQQEDDDEFDIQQQDEDEDEENEKQQPPPGGEFKRQEFQFNNKASSGTKNQDLNTKKVENEQFDEALEIDDSNEIESDDEENEPNNAGTQGAANQFGGDDNAEDDDQQLPGQYNAADYAGLNVKPEVRELFEYIGRYKPQKIDLETSFRPFIPEYMPCVGEVDAFIKMPKPDNTKEDFGITVLDET